MRHKRLRVCVVTLVTSIAALPFNIAPANASETEPHGYQLPVRATAAADWAQLRNNNSGKCLAIPGGSTTPGVTAVQWPCNQPGTTGGYDQVWEFSLFSETSQLKNVGTGLCLAISGRSYRLGAKAIQWPCNGSSEQQWHFTGAYKTRHSGQCLSIASASTANSAQAIQWACDSNPSGNPEQKWTHLFL